MIAGLLLIFIIIAGDIITGAVSSHAPAPAGFLGCTSTLTEQCGTASVIVSSGTGTVSVPFAPNFASTPTITLGPEQWNLPAANSVPTEEVDIVPPNATLCSLAACAGGGFVGLNNWDNLPVALTEVFGGSNTFYRHTIDMSDATGFRFGVDCVVGSSSATALFRIQYSIDIGATWNSLGTAQDVNMNSCNGPGAGTSSGYGSNTYTSLPANSETTTTILRVVGLNGGGSGDNILFGRVWVDFQLQPGINAFNICTTYYQPGILGILKSMDLKIRCTSNTIAGTFKISWIASI